MQNCYVADIGDFGKYGLLSDLCSGRKLGVVWYLVPDEPHKNDGKHIRYLNLSKKALDRHSMKEYKKKEKEKNNRELRSCNLCLYDTLRGIVEDDVRDVREIRRRNVIANSSGIVFYEREIAFDGLAKEERIIKRNEWMKGAYRCTENCDVVFLDPDNGLEVKVGMYIKKGPKFVFFEDLREYQKRGQSLIIYHHLGRQKGGAVVEIKRRKKQLTDMGFSNISVLRWHRGTARVYFVIPANRKHQQTLEKRIKALVQRWSGHFSIMAVGNARKGKLQKELKGLSDKQRKQSSKKM